MLIILLNSRIDGLLGPVIGLKTRVFAFLLTSWIPYENFTYVGPVWGNSLVDPNVERVKHCVVYLNAIYVKPILGNKELSKFFS